MASGPSARNDDEQGERKTEVQLMQSQGRRMNRGINKSRPCPHKSVSDDGPNKLFVLEQV